MNIIGAGLAGLLAGNMLRNHNPVIYERQPTLPNNHHAILRFRTSKIGDVLNIPFKKVTMMKCVQHWRNPVADALSYAKKNTGWYRSDRSITTGTVLEDRYIAPPDLIARMAADCEINFKHQEELPIPNLPVTISTVPMPDLMDMLNYDQRPIFDRVSGISIKAKINNCDAYCSIMVPDPNSPFSRISITGDEMIVECPYIGRNELVVIREALWFLGLKEGSISDVRSFEQKYFKIVPIDEDVRKRFILWASDQYQIFSLGRYATWRPGLLLDDLVQDVRLIEQWSKDRYAMRRSM